MRALVSLYEDWLGPLGGADARTLFDEAARFADRYNVFTRARALASIPLLLAVATDDPSVPSDMHHRPLLDALGAGGAGRVTELVLETDHAFSGKRDALIRSTVQWLDSLFGEGSFSGPR